jgi:adenylate cyclase class 2
VALEIEAKFAVSHLGEIRQRLLDQSARLISDRVLERNWRFDDEAGNLTSEGKVLRLRQDHRGSLTFKEPGGDPHIRTELEFEVGEPEKARQFLESLGYQVIFIYEKYRETYALEPCAIMLDELPFGQFVEIEGASIEAVQQTGRQLGLPWRLRLTMSYADVFKHWLDLNDSRLRDATFAAFRDQGRVLPSDLDLPDALATLPAESD